ncbi:hypothetical protein CPB85DRAFT_1251722 [Mucidula mucida]|nr:hypothetical protein CPB85DRAFT_1251722 [Mucidula mucida]
MTPSTKRKRKHSRHSGGTGGTDDEVSPPLTDGSESSDAAILKSHRLNLCSWTEGLDAKLSTWLLAARYEEASGLYPEFSKAMRLAQKYHPEVSAVVDARVARMGEDGNEPLL